MTEDFIKEIRKTASMSEAILSSVALVRAERRVELRIVTDKSFSAEDEKCVLSAAKKFVPEEFDCKVLITKLAPDEKMIARAVMQALKENSSVLSALVTERDIAISKTANGFRFVVQSPIKADDSVVGAMIKWLKKRFCGEFEGEFVADENKIDDVEIEEEDENLEYVLPVRKFDICDFEFIEGTERQKTAVYISDLNFESENVVICGTVIEMNERTYTRKNGQEKSYFSIALSDTTANMRVTYFTRQKSIEKIKNIKVGDSIVCTGKTELYNGYLRYTANFIDRGRLPDGFVAEKRPSKPAPKFYSVIKPEPYTDFTQSDFFTETDLPDCLKQNTFVVFDLETTGLNSSATGGNMDKIIEIGAYKIINGEIKESFCTFVNPERKLSEEIVTLTGISQSDVIDAPKYASVMPDFFKFCQGAYLVGHNIANFDFKFVDYYCAKCGYMLERKLFDTMPLAQSLLRLSNYKLNTIADYFNITFNHHRASADALVTAKIFIELIKIKKSLPKCC